MLLSMLNNLFLVNRPSLKTDHFLFLLCTQTPVQCCCSAWCLWDINLILIWQWWRFRAETLRHLHYLCAYLPLKLPLVSTTTFTVPPQSMAYSPHQFSHCGLSPFC